MSESNIESINLNNPEVLKDIEASLRTDLLRDFYQTFRLSQGETSIQPPLFDMLADMYQLRDDFGSIDEAIKTASKSVEKLMPPSQHAPTNKETRLDSNVGFIAMWGDFTSSVKGEARKSLRTPELMLDDILAADQKFIKSGRPRGRTGDPCESILREYIMGEKLKGSEQLLQVRDFLRNVLVVSLNSEYTFALKHRYYQVTKSWQVAHPGQQFDAYIIDNSIDSVNLT